MAAARCLGAVSHVGEGPGFDPSRIYEHVGARSCRHRLCLEGGYDGAGGDAWGDALAELDSAALAAAFLANLGLQPLAAEANGVGMGLGAAAGAGEGARVPDAAEGSTRGGMVRQ